MVRRAHNDLLETFWLEEMRPGMTPSQAAKARTSGLVIIIGLLWLAGIVTGSFLMLQHAERPGPEGAAPPRWPASSPVPFDNAHPTLVMFLHPQCPCTRATIGELERLMAHSQGLVSVHLWFLRPAGMTENWVETDLWHSAGAIPGVTRHCDDEGAIARLFHAETSGQADLYDRDGRLLFQGGITIARGHAGDSSGGRSLAALLAHQSPDAIKTPVFGCTLSDTPSTQEEKAWKP